MANGFDRLERFFTSKRKVTSTSTASSSSSTAPSTAPSSPVAPPSLDLSFPSPSFIRPKTSRMAAREECRPRQSSASPTSLDASSPQRKDSTTSGISSKSYRLSKAYRPLSFGTECREQLEWAFQGLEFPKPPSRHGNSDLSAKPLPEIPRIQASRPSSPLKVGIPTSRLDTPPSSEPEDSPLSLRRPRARKLQITPYQAPPTPESSPEIGPMADWKVDEHKCVDILDENLCKDIQRQLEQSVGQLPFNNSLERVDSYSINSFATDSFASQSLQEPDFDEFFSLSDENVAETQMNDSVSPLILSTPVTVASSVSSLPFCEPPVLKLEPPCSSQATTAAAFEAARIASRYNFDMLYVVNLWPEEPSFSPVGDALAASSKQGMTGRLLAAYGLHNAPSPFQVSSDVHIKVLQSQGWLEYRDEKALGGDFSRAYACGFYPGQYEDRRPFSQKSTACKMQTSAIDRGIVFAAYRKPSADGTTHCSSAQELVFLRRDVEAMVEMFIDIHVANQLRQPPVHKYPYETGPIPA